MKIPYTKQNQETDKLKNSGLILGNEKRTSGAFETIWESIIYFVVGAPGIHKHVYHFQTSKKCTLNHDFQTVGGTPPS